MPYSIKIIRELDELDPKLKGVFLAILEEIEKNVKETVKKSDFDELKQVVLELAEAQKRTEQRVSRLEKAVEELAHAQKRTEQRVEELAEAQKRTEEEIKKLAMGLNRTREELGGLQRTFSYSFENEAFRNLPRILKDKYGLVVKDRFIRADVGGKEINFLAKAQKDGKEVYIVGEAKLRLDDTTKRPDVFKELEEKVEAVESEYGKIDIVRLLVTHFATKGFLEKARKKNIIVVQSFEW